MQIITRQEAKEKGLSRYFTGKPCKRGHIDERQIRDGYCVSCANQVARESWRKNDKRKKYLQEWKRKNKDKILAYSKKHREVNAEKIKSSSKKYLRSDKAKETRQLWDKKNRDTQREKKRLYNYAHAEKVRSYKKKWKLKNPHVVAAMLAFRRAAKINATPHWVCKDSLKLKYLERDTMRKLTGEEYHVDHIIPLVGKNICGLHVPWNLQVIPASDNLRKSNKLIA